MLENLDFEHDYYSRTATCICRIGHESIRLLNWLFFDDKFYWENLHYYDLTGYVLKYLNEIS